jgi:hypothetical protein
LDIKTAYVFLGQEALDDPTRVSYSEISLQESAAEGGNSIRVTSKFYYRFAFIYRFSFTEERAGETRADHARNRS